MSSTRSTFTGVVAALGTMVLLYAAAMAEAPAAQPQAAPLTLPPLDRWTPQEAIWRATADDAEMQVAEMYRPARVVSPVIAADARAIYTVSARVAITYPSLPENLDYHLEVEALTGDKVLASTPSPTLQGARPDSLLAATLVTPDGTTGLRVTLVGRIRVARVDAHRISVRAMQVRRLSGAPGSRIDLELTQPLPNAAGAREARLIARADWPDGTAVAVTTTRGRVRASVLLDRGRAEVSLDYDTATIGRTHIEAAIGDARATAVVADPHAALLRLAAPSASADAVPVLIQIGQNGTWLPGRYRTVRGFFVQAPWEMELAPGRWQVRISRGPQRPAVDREVTLVAGQPTMVAYEEGARAADRTLTRFGWYGGDPDGDVYHGERVYTDVTAETAATISRAMGLDWVAAGNWGSPSPRTWGEAEAVTRRLSAPDFLFLWTDERPKARAGHACLVGVTRPHAEPFDEFWTKTTPLHNYEQLQALRTSGAATMVNHPIRWWLSGEEFITNMYAALPFDAAAAGLLDGLNINEGGEPILQLWSMLLDAGYRVAATGGSDFCLDRSPGPVPGEARMYVHSTTGLHERALVDGIRQGKTIVSTGPLLVADIGGQPPGTSVAPDRRHRIQVRAWPRQDRPDRLQRVELWAHGRVQAARELAGAADHESTFEWQPSSSGDWVAVRVVAESGWAMTSAFYAGDRARGPVQARVRLRTEGVSAARLRGASLEVWDNWPDAPGARRLQNGPLDAYATAHASAKPDAVITAPVTATLVVRFGDGSTRRIRLYEAAGLPAIVDRIAAGAERERPLFDPQIYDEVRRRAEEIVIDLQESAVPISR